jgi:hypothetical protein
LGWPSLPVWNVPDDSGDREHELRWGGPEAVRCDEAVEDHVRDGRGDHECCKNVRHPDPQDRVDVDVIPVAASDGGADVRWECVREIVWGSGVTCCVGVGPAVIPGVWR